MGSRRQREHPTGHADDVEFLKKMLYEAARWNPDWPREPIEEVLADRCSRATTRGGADRATPA